MERKLRFLEKEIKKDDIPMLDAGRYILKIKGEVGILIPYWNYDNH